MFLNHIVGSLLFMTAVHPFLMIFWCINYIHKGSINSFFNKILETGMIEYFLEFWPSPFDLRAMFLIGSFALFELFLMLVVPGPTFTASVTATGHKPVYVANGIACYYITFATLVYLIIHDNHYNYVGDIYDKFGNILSSLNVFAITFCALLCFKGIYYPSTKDLSRSGSLIVDYFWGTELHPHIFGWDVKQYTNCRFGIMFWQMGVIALAYQQFKIAGSISSSMMVSVILQSVYIFKFFLWETGYFCSTDIQHNRAGYFMCWRFLVGVPSLHLVHTLFLVENPVYLSPPVTAAFLLSGLLCIWCNYDCDRQRQEFRLSGGRLKIWGSDAEYIVARYTVNGQARTSLLLHSGWWGLARHFHYAAEIMGSVIWSCPGVCHIVTSLYPFYLLLLLAYRANRDDSRCAEKYGQHWQDYCTKVPYKIIPGII